MVDVAEIKRQVTPADVIERYTGSRRRHNKYLCPFHSDKHPSLSVKADTWKCWACGTGGDVLNFTQKYFGLSFVEAAEKLANDFNLNIETTTPTKPDIWAQVEAECRQKRQQELRQVRKDITQEIVTLTAVHRCLYHLGYYEAAERYANELDDLERYKELWR
jgi:DNA primase